MDLKALLVRSTVALVGKSSGAGGVLSVVRAGEDDEDGRPGYKVVCYGPERLFDYRHVRKYPGWPLIGGDGKPTGTYDLSYTGLQYGTIMKRLIQESMLWPGGDLPLVFEADRAGTRERTYEAVDGKPVIDALDDIADNEAGVEYAFIPEIDDLDNISWRFVTGTDATGLSARASTCGTSAVSCQMCAGTTATRTCPRSRPRRCSRAARAATARSWRAPPPRT